MSETKKILNTNSINNSMCSFDDFDENEFNNIVEGWDPSLRGYSIKWNHQKRKWIVMK